MRRPQARRRVSRRKFLLGGLGVLGSAGTAADGIRGFPWTKAVATVLGKIAEHAFEGTIGAILASWRDRSEGSIEVLAHEIIVTKYCGREDFLRVQFLSRKPDNEDNLWVFAQPIGTSSFLPARSLVVQTSSAGRPKITYSADVKTGPMNPRHDYEILIARIAPASGPIIMAHLAMQDRDCRHFEGMTNLPGLPYTTVVGKTKTEGLCISATDTPNTGFDKCLDDEPSVGK